MHVSSYAGLPLLLFDVLLRQLASHTRLRCAAIIGGMAMQKQERLLSRHPHVVIATPGPCLPLLELFSCPVAQLSPHLGRLWEFISSGHSYFASLHALRMVVIDEADRMLTSGHFKELQVIALLWRFVYCRDLMD